MLTECKLDAEEEVIIRGHEPRYIDLEICFLGLTLQFHL